MTGLRRTEGMRVGVLGSGGREHALAWALARSPRADAVFVLPGNGGTVGNQPVDPADPEAVASACARLDLDLLVVGPEGALVTGLVDRLSRTTTVAFGPGAQAARLEGSKQWAKAFMVRHGIPTAAYEIVETEEAVRSLAEAWDGRMVLKADGLAGGKGVTVCSSIDEAVDGWRALRAGRPAGEPILAEKRLEGWELSILVITDGQAASLFPPSQDHKPVFDGDRGPNTGGMGAFAPVAACDGALQSRIRDGIIEPTLMGLRADGISYRGFLYFGLMITPSGPQLLEYNVRLGDPEAEVVLPLLRSDLLTTMVECIDGWLPGMRIEDGFAVDVVLAAGGYPGKPALARTIYGLDAVPEDVRVFHGGTRRVDGVLETSGGRVLHIVGRGETLDAAIDRAYAGCAAVSFDGMQYRRDIGRRGEGS